MRFLPLFLSCFLLLVGCQGEMKNRPFKVTLAGMVADGGLIVRTTDGEGKVEVHELPVQKELTLLKGTWTFEVIAFAGAAIWGGNTKCGTVTKVLALDVENVDIPLYDANCSSAPFADLITEKQLVPPTSLSLVNVNSPTLATTLQIDVSGVQSGDQVRLFIDSACVNEVANNTAAGSSVTITSSGHAQNSIHTFYANTTRAGFVSACSTASLNVDIRSCPTGYIGVSQDPASGIPNDFCIAQFEMKGSAATPVSQAAGLPVTNVTVVEAQGACQGIGANYDLITNTQWMHIARTIAQVDSNWSSGTAGTGFLPRGHSDYSPATKLAVSDQGNEWDSTGETSSIFNQRRTLFLAAGQLPLWDFAGNVSELVDWFVPPSQKAYALADSNPIHSAKEFSALDTLISAGDTMAPETWLPTYMGLGSGANIGTYYGGTNATGGQAVRGGNYASMGNGGLFTLNLQGDTTFSAGELGFRCVWSLL